MGVVGSEAFGGLATADATGDVVLAVDHVVEQTHDRALIIHVVGFHGHIGHACVVIGGPHGMAHGLVLTGCRSRDSGRIRRRCHDSLGGIWPVGCTCHPSFCPRPC